MDDEQPFQAVLMSTARELVERGSDGDLELAVVAAQMACEIQTEIVISELFDRRGLSELGRIVRAPGALRGNNLRDDRVRQLYGELSGDDIASKSFWSDFVAHAKLRNAVVHSGRRVDPAEAEASVRVAAELTAHLAAVLREHGRKI